LVKLAVVGRMFFIGKSECKIDRFIFTKKKCWKKIWKEICKSCLGTFQEFFKTESVGFEELDTVGH
jgi:hypothetical protein